MKGIILAGGTGSRLYPLTKVTNKHLLPVGKYPMVFYAVYKLQQAAIEEILVVTGREHMGDVVNLLGSGDEFGVSFTYKVQDQPGGIAQALGLAEKFTVGDLMTVILGDNICSDEITPFVERFKEQGKGARLLLKEVEDPQRYGVPEVIENRIVGIEEKPDYPKSRFAVTGIYMYDSQVFDIIRSLKPSGRGELEITDVNNAYIDRNELSYDLLHGWWSDAGTHLSWFRANQLVQGMDLDLALSGKSVKEGESE